MIPPKDGEATTKNVFQDGERKKYHWCEFHAMWTKHEPVECKMLPVGRNISKKYTGSKKTEFKKRKKAYMQAKAALQALGSSSSSDGEDSVTSTSSNSSNRSFDSNTS